ncbi:unnamed protein product [Linum tenue]|uniref:Uncharacterized protein n=1 Tax=Linum tenue TaxID=586396 RepID=A0AAV0LBZ2_9ROSI|nr:unnamed protein product [Linum tenue]
MTDERRNRVSSADSLRSATEYSQSRQRKRRKWDEPAESLAVSVGVAVPGCIPLYSGVASASSALLTNPPLVASYAIVSPALQVASVPQSSRVPAKLYQAKIQDELIIAREIVINDAEALVRYKLTKRQTQDEIQKSTGAVVITRLGPYKQFYENLVLYSLLLKDTTERILAVDRAAAMVEEMLKQGQNVQSSIPIFSKAASNGVMDQYINHIMNETGASVVLRGRESQQPLHLFLSSTNSRSLEHAQSLAENLLQTIRLECGVSRVGLAKGYNAVPPPQQLLTGVESSGNLSSVNTCSVADIASPTMTSIPSIEASSSTVPNLGALGSQGVLSSAGGMVGFGLHQLSSVAYPQHLTKGGTSYSGYGGIYPQATPLQQVALVLRHTPSINSTVTPVISVGSATPLENTNTYKSTSCHSEKETAMQKRKFQELPIRSKAPAKQFQVSKLDKLSELPSTRLRVKPPSKACVSQTSNGMSSPRPRGMPPPSMANSMAPPAAPRLIPPSPSAQYMAPSEIITSGAQKRDAKISVRDETQLDKVPETLIKLMEYGDDDDDDEQTGQLLGNGSNSSSTAVGKPFWAA